MTSALNPKNIRFDPEPRHLIPPNHPRLDPITASKRSKARAGTSRATRHSDADDEGTPVSLYGTQRYHFEPYGGTTPNLALRESLALNAKLQKWNKMQDRTISKLTNSVKILKRQMQKVTALLAKTTIGSGCQRDDVMGEACPSMLPRPSYYKRRSEPNEPARTSDYELRTQKPVSTCS
ncbi:hypothetical protein F2Q69_00040882 [Brassica cretica]|uniref:Arabidopsis retrotransposon Orf1 C-terminal domain-containing protein n=1 Tax=Brassica cretica TaxID=69181 RepID=A0A8S9NA85_BRACR|nr:hypothetical protein F2Q69_00040882 [Brassica cretica]